MENILKGATRIGESEWEMRSLLFVMAEYKKDLLKKILKLQIELKELMIKEKETKEKLSKLK